MAKNAKAPRSNASTKSSATPVPSKKMARKPANPATAAPIHLPGSMWEQIARKAYELFEQRGRIEGRDLQDWFDAEAMVMKEIHGTGK